ncbi:aspartyl beta hydroxylase [Naegleria gruberi]|uniref:Aspartyl beta hydroxylase n=1 Tax=Naegleria gruberi TaxID=5762 RepID=D2VAJ6_NAEGR|nr:aspartyl beta hydroxylase [Naegleria gruberi]EFC46087.1 aspartyl beta hydroxylase [Naegleria gruberi]|eukprot:XP_002678831.1 aspartyl beta hydroxylase [Naegleria gruberi strain NEG-M]
MLSSSSSTAPPSKDNTDQCTPSSEEINACKEMMIKQLTEEYSLPDIVEELKRTKLRLVYCLYEFLINSNRLHQSMRYPNLFVYPHIGNDEPYYDVNYHNYELKYDYSIYSDIQLRLESYFEDIKSEFINNYLNIDDLNIDNIKSSVTGQWNAIYLVNQGKIDEQICKLFPNTTNIIEDILGFNDRICRLNIGYVYFSIIHKGTHIKPHCGVSNIKLRIQLPLIVNDHVTMKVKNVERQYNEGEIIILDDSFVHEVIYKDANDNLILDQDEQLFSSTNNENIELDEPKELSSEEIKQKRREELSDIRVVLLIDINHPDLTKEELDLIQVFFAQLDGSNQN